MEQEFGRAYKKTLKNWLVSGQRKPLVIRGARQVGKSTMVRSFAKQNGLILHEVNLEKHPALEGVFKSLDVGLILRELAAIVGRTIESGQPCLLFLDEIQACPSVLPALRYFHEEKPLLPVVAAGSLLDFALAKAQYSMPVGRIDYLFMHPLSFEEFLAAVGEDQLLSYVRESVLPAHGSSAGAGIPAAAHRRLLERQREFLFVGGMPEAVGAFAGLKREQRNLSAVVATQRSIVRTYRDDFAKYSTQHELQRLQRLFDVLPTSVGVKIKYSNLARDERARETRAALELLAKARLITRIHHSSCAGIPLAAQADQDRYKIIFLDVGLLNRLLGLDWQSIGSMDERTLINEGPLAEQFVGQELLVAGGEAGLEESRLFYWLRENKSSNAEVDYVLAHGRRIVPIEVKAGKSGTLKSVVQFVEEKKVDIAIRLDLNEASAQRLQPANRRAFDLISLPLYLAGQIPRYLAEF
ncbi:AAA family ATPase [Bdellovibrionota bacterium FG-1]